MASEHQQSSASDRPEPLTLKTLGQFLASEQAMKAIEPMLPEGQKYSRIVREVMNSAADQPGILDCELGSIVRAVSRAVSYDLVIGEGVFLVPQKDRASDPQPKLHARLGYLGKAELMVRHRAARFVDFHAVFENEHYRCEQGTSAFVEHRPIMDKEKRGKVVGAYAFAKMTQFDFVIIEIGRDEVDAIRQKFSHQWKTKTIYDNGQKKIVQISLDEIPWYLEARCVHRLGKKVPMRGKMAQIMEESGGEEPEHEAEIITPRARPELSAGAAQPIEPPMKEPVAVERDDEFRLQEEGQS